MILQEAQQTSIVVSLLRYFYKRYQQIEQKLTDIYSASQTYRLAERFWKKIKIYFRHSFLGRITQTGQKTFIALDNSHLLQALINSYKRCRDKIIHYSETSLGVKLVKDAEERLFVRTISLIVIITIFVNAVVSFILQQQMGLWGFCARVLFLFTGAAGLSCQADWPTVKQSSSFFKQARRV